MSDEPAPETAEDPSGTAQPGSLLGDVASLVEDGKTYAEAEIAFQKTRFVYAARHAKWVVALGGLAIVLVVLALVALVIGALIGLIPALGPWGATAVVVGALLLATLAAWGIARAHWRQLTAAFGEDEE